MRLDHLDARTFTPHRLHADDRVWTQTNCYLDIWIEIVAALGADPEALGVVAFSGGTVPGAWAFLKPQTDDLRALYGLEVGEINLWRTVEEHVLEHLAAGELVTVESDAWWLPDTEGVSYRTERVKTTIVPVRVDPRERTMTYFHNSGLYALSGEDYDGALAVEGTESCTPQPYVERVRLAEPVPGGATLRSRARTLAREHLARRPADNPVVELAASVRALLPSLPDRGMDFFHRYSFTSTRQLGLTAQAAADASRWLARGGGPGADELDSAATDFDVVSQEMKNLQFALARITGGRRRDVEPTLQRAVEHWGRAVDRAATTLG
ncbi:DUF1839 family protein [Arsenicicoccus sp. oral taxon 190]|uniref:DUF1839 family protein n=1 Tax=Arsenicicoccus sp. oral taxon 190 TaxID=1658671 RepID=UPI00067A16C1|nr:DUF1839 family protein [Arsenicicoccus sp. oral taxon 190]AKT50188.1 hypothetical protein ADJ73_00540 [Arsenicicoccus sp. oral taxon 190]